MPSTPRKTPAATRLPGRAPVSAFVTVMKGCDERCSFCIVPTTRGPERYRPARDIVDEIARLVSDGTLEVTLLGQTVNSYRDPERSLPSEGREVDDESEFAWLIRRIVAEVPGLLRLRYTSPHPRHLTRALVAAHAELPTLVRHVHLPVQSGSDRVLKRMIRRYTATDYRERVARLRAAVPGVTLSTDVIVGFPGETREDFEATLELVRDIEFTGLFGFKYSQRPNTPALRFADDVSEEEKSERLAELFTVADAYRRAHLESRVGLIEDVLVEGRGRGNEYSGRSERNEIVHVESGDVDPSGQLVKVKIERAYKNSLFGSLAEAPSIVARESRPRVRQLPLVG